MTITDINIFLAIVQNHNITKTAQQLFLSQSTISHRLALLEKEIGKPLIIRGKGQKTVSLTPYGEDFIPLANQWKALYEETVRLHLHPDYMELSVGGVHSINNYALLPFYQHLRHTCPTLKLSLNTHNSWEIYEFVNMQKIDVGFVNNLVYYNGLKAVPIFRERFCLVTYSREEQSKVIPKHPTELDPHREIFHTYSMEYKQWHDYWWGTSPKASVTVNEANLLEYFLSQEGEWAILPLSVAKSLQVRRPLQINPILDPPPDRTCYMVTNQAPRTKCKNSLKLFQEKLDKFLQSPGHMDLITMKDSKTEDRYS